MALPDGNSRKYFDILSDLSSTITENATEIEKEINQHFDEIIQTLNARRHQLINDINKSKSTLLNEINDEIKSIDNKNNNNLDSSQYLTNKILSLSQSFEFKSELKLSSFSNVCEIIGNEKNCIVPVLNITDIQRDTKKSNHPFKCWIKIKWNTQNLKHFNIDNASKSIIKFKKRNGDKIDNNWIIGQYATTNMIENNSFECTLTDKYFFQYDEEYLFQIQYKTATPLKMTIYSEIKSIKFDSCTDIENIRSLKKYCNWYEVAPLIADRKMFKQWRQRKQDILQFIKYIGDKDTEPSKARNTWFTINDSDDSDEEDIEDKDKDNNNNTDNNKERMSIKLNNAIKECHEDYQKYLNSDHPLSYCLYDFMQLNQTKNERDKLWKIFDEMEECNYIGIDMGIIDIIASFCASIYGRATSSGSIHFCYGAILPNKHIYDNVSFRRKESRIRFADDTNRLYGEIVHIFERNHVDPTILTEGTYSRLDIVLYYEEHDIYCITQLTDNSENIELIDFKLHRDFLVT